MTVILLAASETGLADARCDDCGDVLREHDDVRCRWCEDNRSRHPEDYDPPITTRRVEAGRAVAG
jgi:hypothetical protein